MLETRRAKECQRGIARAAERAKEGGRVPFESSDTRLGPHSQTFEPPHTGPNTAKQSERASNISKKQRIISTLFLHFLQSQMRKHPEDAHYIETSSMTSCSLSV